MKIKSLFVLISLIIMLALIVPAGAQSCSTVGLSVTYQKIDAGGYAPRIGNGAQAQFDCIAGRDPNFASRRFNSSWEALNYWFSLVSPSTGLYLQPLPAPTS